MPEMLKFLITDQKTNIKKVTFQEQSTLMHLNLQIGKMTMVRSCKN